MKKRLNVDCEIELAVCRSRHFEHIKKRRTQTSWCFRHLITDINEL